MIYINDIYLSSSSLKFILFADDANALFSNAAFNMLQDILISELEKVSNWLMANKLTVDIKKTMLFLRGAKNNYPPCFLI